MFKLIILLFVGALFHIIVPVSGRRAQDFGQASAQIPLYLQKQMNDLTNTKITRAQNRRLAPSSPYVVLTISSNPLSICTIGDDTQTNFGGFHVEVFKAIATQLGWVQGVDYIFSCVSRATLNTRVANNDNITCGVGAVAITSDKIKSGLKFPQPITSTGMVMVMRREDSRTYWSFLLPISWKIAVGFLIINIIITLFLWFFEETRWKRSYKEHFTNLLEVMYDTFGSLYFTNAIEFRRISSKIVLWIFWIILTIFINIYQAELTAKLSPSYIQRDYKSFEDAVTSAKTFASSTQYNTILQLVIDPTAYNIKYYNDTGNVDTNINEMFTDLKNKVVDGVLLPEAVAQYYTNIYCNIQRLDDLIGEFNYGIVFPSAGDNTMISEMSQAIIKLRETFQIKLIQNKLDLAQVIADCTNTESITVKEVAGLWVILCIAILFAFGLHLLKRFKLIVPVKDHKFPYYNYLTKKTELFENQLKQAVEFEMDKILDTYKDQLMEDIEDFETTLLLQQRKKHHEGEGKED